MNQPRRANPTVIALYIVAALLLANLVAMLSRDGSSGFVSPAFAQRQPPIAGGAGIFIMPAQLTSNSWGCYMLDVDNGTLCVYQYLAGEKRLHFMAARDYRNDRRLKNFSTLPDPNEVGNWVEKEQKGARGADPDAPPPSETLPKTVP